MKKTITSKDCYRTFSELSEREREGKDYRIRLIVRNSPIAVLAPHGGLIEPGSCIIAEAIAASMFSLYTFSGCKKTGNATLHLTATRFDEPLALGLLKTVRTVVSVHGCRGKTPQVHVGGRDFLRVAAIISALRTSGVMAWPAETGLAGRHGMNLCNRGTSGMGVQLELSMGLRQQLCPGHTAHSPRLAAYPGQALLRFAQAVRNGLSLRYTRDLDNSVDRAKANGNLDRGPVTNHSHHHLVTYLV